MVFKFIVLLSILHTVLSLSDNATYVEKKMDVNTDGRDSILHTVLSSPDNATYVEKKMDVNTDGRDVLKKEAGRRSRNGGDQAWSKTILACIRDRNDAQLKTPNIGVCKEKCVEETSFVCQSVDYNPSSTDCNLSTARSTSNAYTEPCYYRPGLFQFAERIHASCKDIGGTCMSDFLIKRNRCKGKANKNFLCNVKRPNCCIERCPVNDDFFMMYNQCFKFIDIPLKWSDAKVACENEGLILARPFEVMELRNYLVFRYGVGYSTSNQDKYHRVQVWLDAQTDGKCVSWNHGPPGCISPDLPYWYPESSVATGNCLLLASNAYNMMMHPTKPIATAGCDHYQLYPLCELPM